MSRKTINWWTNEKLYCVYRSDWQY